MGDGSIRNIFNEVRERAGFRKFRPYLMRHESVTIQISNARLLGIDAYEVALRNDHTEETCLRYYNDIVRSGVEFLTREPAKLVGFVEDVCCHHLQEFLRNPHQLRHFAAYEEAKRILGNLQLTENLKQYRDGSLADFTTNNHSEQLQQFLTKGGTIQQPLPWKESLGRIIRKNMFSIQ
jgi:hypothetical protein